ncbi:DotA/TraY family protein [uncultured Tateyamaria sp.]|uniref:DotA/TraY family protein n=1 Tax=uncultured Tateyamaria sp. TaxID=455651 RepID=UPI00261971C0|nr:DotA/TraY family protein [uncultured Tateyamaria sp.]
MDPDDFSDLSDLYTVADSDYALNALERLFGGIIPYLSGQDDVYNQVGTFLSPLIGMLNMVVLVLAVIVGAYTLLTTMAETATDGQLLGRSTNTVNTFFRAGLAALAFLPVSGGLSVIQLLAFGVAIMGSGIANQGWNWFATQSLDGASYSTPTEALTGGDWQLRGKMGEATYTMVLGRLCELHLDRLSGTLDIQAQTTPQAVPRTLQIDVINGWTGRSEDYSGETKIFEWFYRTGAGANASNDICGSVKYSINYNVPKPDADPGMSTSLFSFSENLATLAKNDVYDAVVSAMESTVRPRAIALADRIYSGNPGDTDASLRNDAVVQTEIRSIASDAAVQVFASRSAISSDTAAVQGIQNELVASVTQNGWIMAPIWQRGLASLNTTLRELQSNLDLSIDAEHRIDRVFGTGFWGYWTSDNQVSQASFQPVERDFEYLETHLPFVDRLSQPDAGSQTSPIGTDAGAEMANQTTQMVYRFMLEKLGPGVNNTSNFEDPFMDYTDMGGNLVLIGSPLLALGGLGDAVVGERAGIITGPLKAMGFYLISIGVVFMLIIPSIPILYFFSGVMSWFALVIEAVFALPLALLMWLVPAREPSMIGPWNKVMVTLCGLLLRPIFIIVGLIACVLLLWLGNQILGVIFGNMLLVMTPGWGVLAVVMLFGLIGLYAYASVLLALHCSSLINLFGDAVMGWIGGLPSALNRETIGENMASGASGQVRTPSAAALNQGIVAGGAQIGGGVNAGRAKIASVLNRPRLTGGGN